MAAQEADESFHWHYGELDDKNFRVRGSNFLVLVVVFSALLFVTLVCLYVRWACGHRRPPVVPSSGAVAARPPGLDPGTIDSFPMRVHRPSAAPGDDALCSICLSGLVEGEKVRVLPGCSHSFHPECVDEWLRAQSSCPLCRAALVGSAVKPEEAAV